MQARFGFLKPKRGGGRILRAEEEKKQREIVAKKSEALFLETEGESHCQKVHRQSPLDILLRELLGSKQ
jgi:hypothetical protein